MAASAAVTMRSFPRPSDTGHAAQSADRCGAGQRVAVTVGPDAVLSARWNAGFGSGTVAGQRCQNSRRQPSTSAQKAIGKPLIGAPQITVWQCVPSQLRFVMAFALRSPSAAAASGACLADHPAGLVLVFVACAVVDVNRRLLRGVVCAAAAAGCGVCRATISPPWCGDVPGLAAAACSCAGGIRTDVGDMTAAAGQLQCAWPARLCSYGRGSARRARTAAATGARHAGSFAGSSYG